MNKTENCHNHCTIQEVDSIAKAEDIIKFFLSFYSFDAALTPGEIEQIYREPFISLRSRDIKYWYALNDNNEIIAAIGVKETEHHTSGYCITFIAVDRRYRHEGIGKILVDKVLNYVRSKKGRFLIVDTSDRPEYEPMRNFMSSYGFIHVGTFPDYYYKGESTIWYYYKIEE